MSINLPKDPDIYLILFAFLVIIAGLFLISLNQTKPTAIIIGCIGGGIAGYLISKGYKGLKKYKDLNIEKKKQEIEKIKLEKELIEEKRKEQELINSGLEYRYRKIQKTH